MISFTYIINELFFCHFGFEESLRRALMYKFYIMPFVRLNASAKACSVSNIDKES